VEIKGLDRLQESDQGSVHRIPNALEEGDSDLLDHDEYDHL
jgi:hypothetical protein